jgi:hypothetical protein
VRNPDILVRGCGQECPRYDLGVSCNRIACLTGSKMSDRPIEKRFMPVTLNREVRPEKWDENLILLKCDLLSIISAPDASRTQTKLRLLACAWR